MSFARLSVSDRSLRAILVRYSFRKLKNGFFVVWLKNLEKAPSLIFTRAAASARVIFSEYFSLINWQTISMRELGISLLSENSWSQSILNSFDFARSFNNCNKRTNFSKGGRMSNDDCLL